MIEVFRSGEEIEGRLVSFLLMDPTNDGGQWDMLVNLINKYGVMPKKCFPDSHSAGATRRMCAILKSKVRDQLLNLLGWDGKNCFPDSLGGGGGYLADVHHSQE